MSITIRPKDSRVRLWGLRHGTFIKWKGDVYMVIGGSSSVTVTVIRVGTSNERDLPSTALVRVLHLVDAVFE